MIPLEKVEAIYFGGAPKARTQVAPAPSQDTLDALIALRSVTESGIAYRDYAPRVLDARVKVDRYLSTSKDSPELTNPIRIAMREYELASQVWNNDPLQWSNKAQQIVDDPIIFKCPAIQEAIQHISTKIHARP